ncbi:hypothetical protein [Bartonella tamiae]|uniref:hypothetical protein n=1 Tax=Bartonella tamiae TaxID=373638 RepID=UPI00026E77B3|nr:hypothetical protein [Bartonella tamiae]EJF92658.1 hypothetical protein MEG_01828 [Bartonella tamiae Th307]
MADSANSTTLSENSIKLTDLSFVKASDGTRRHLFWNVKNTNKYEIDESLGQVFALEYLAYEAQLEGDHYPILPSIIADMPRDLTGIEITFLGLVGFAAIDGRREAKRIADYWAETIPHTKVA